jgi:hypothetical protein
VNADNLSRKQTYDGASLFAILRPLHDSNDPLLAACSDGGVVQGHPMPRLAMLRPVLSPVLLAALIACPRDAAGQTTDEREAVATVHRLFDAMRTRDTAAMRALFVPNARLFGMRTRQNGEVVLQSLTSDEFASFVARDARAPWIERAFDPEVRVRGTLATVWAEYDFHFGTQFSHCGVDAVQLLKVPDRGWQIVSIADTFEREGCRSR